MGFFLFWVQLGKIDKIHVSTPVYTAVS